jgi:response regulator RpfG family c-di-GMP phosphodiesterase
MEDDEPPDLKYYYDRFNISEVNRISISGYMGLLFGHSPVTGEHSMRVCYMGVRLGEFLIENNFDILVSAKQIFYSSCLHDTGKLRVASNILEEPWEFREQHIDEIRKHALEGYNILTGDRDELNAVCPGLRNHNFSGLAGCLLHHEYQGDFYPKHLPNLRNDFSFETIKLAFDCSKLIALTDGYDAGVNRNGHISHEEGMKRIMSDAGKRERELLRLIELQGCDRDIFLEIGVKV